MTTKEIKTHGQQKNALKFSRASKEYFFRWPDYPSLSCSSAAPNSVSPDHLIVIQRSIDSIPAKPDHRVDDQKKSLAIQLNQRKTNKTKPINWPV
jgi:hypothetical protein